MPDSSEDDVDWAAVLRVMREAAERSRGYASYWEWTPDRSQAEVGVVQVLASFLSHIEGVSCATVRPLPDDPPDVLLELTNGRRLGVEVTELVSPEAAALHRHRKRTGKGDPFAWADWPPEAVATALVKAVEIKDAKLARRRADFDEVLLAIATDEPMITLGVAEQALRQCAPAVKAIGRAFLLLSYHPEVDKGRFPEGCPVLPITLRTVGQ